MTRRFLQMRGIITPLLEWIVEILTAPSRILAGRKPFGGETFWSPLRTSRPEWTPEMARRSAIVEDAQILGFIFIQIVLLFLIAAGTASWLRVAAEWLAVYRVVTIVAFAIRMPLFSVRRGSKVTSHVRMVVNGLCNYGEMILSFAILYAVNGASVKVLSASGDLAFGSMSDYLYFSGITQFTIGYGDMVPVGVARIIVCSQAAAGVLVLVLLVARFISLLGTVQEYEGE